MNLLTIVRVAAMLISGAVLSMPALAQVGNLTAVPNELAVFMRSEFERVPAPSIAERVAGARCAMQDLGALTGAAYSGRYVCRMSFGCGVTRRINIWVKPNGGFAFDPGGPGMVAATLCPDAITDPAVRERLIRGDWR